MIKGVVKKITSLLLAVAVVSGTITATAPLQVQAAGIPAGAKAFQGHMYYVYKEKSNISMEAAQQKCRAVGGHLVSITSAKEQEFVSKLLKSTYYNGGSAWIGGIYNNGVASWVTGEKMSFVAADSAIPNSTSNRLQMYCYNGKWFRQSGDSSYLYDFPDLYICEWDTSTANVLPDQTEGVKVKKIDGRSITVSWSKVSGAKGYSVYMKAGKNGSYKKIKDSKDPSITSCYKSGLKKGTTYYFLVRAFKYILGERSYGELSDEKKITM